jgi:hypothetical protein
MRKGMWLGQQRILALSVGAPAALLVAEET